MAPLAQPQRSLTMEASEYVKTYMEQLSRCNLGTPLWRPDPYLVGETPVDAAIGDVGCIDLNNGSWVRFFNIFDDPPTCPTTTAPYPRRVDDINSYPRQLEAQMLAELKFEDKDVAIQLGVSPLYAIDSFRLQDESYINI